MAMGPGSGSFGSGGNLLGDAVGEEDCLAAVVHADAHEDGLG